MDLYTQFASTVFVCKTLSFQYVHISYSAAF